MNKQFELLDIITLLSFSLQLYNHMELDKEAKDEVSSNNILQEIVDNFKINNELCTTIVNQNDKLLETIRKEI